jgi:acyl-CoA reductase-like NAD-dependent aldehyde dehydrogenase
MASLGTTATAVQRDDTSQTTIIPHTQKPLCTREYPSGAELDAAIERAHVAQDKWKRVPLEERIKIGYRFIVRALQPLHHTLLNCLILFDNKHI